MPPEMLGKAILEKHGQSEANEAVLHELRLRKALLHQENYHHSYPHCWRSKNPVIFRATDQWFIKIEREVLATDFPSIWHGGPYNFRQAALAAIDQINWIPEWGVNR